MSAPPPVMRPCRARRREPRAQRGAALLTAMIIVTLVATLAAAMVWQQWRAVQVESAERARTQAAWVLSGALDFARLILREDFRSGKATGLTEPWATPLAEARLSTFLSTDAQDTDDGPEAFLSGSISDAQARFNLLNLTIADATARAPWVKTFLALCQNVGVDTGVAQRIASSLLDAVTSPTGGSPLLPRNLSQLAWLGVDAGTIEALRPYVVILDGPGVPVNVNTAPKELLAAVMDINPSAAQVIVAAAQRTPYPDPSAAFPPNASAQLRTALTAKSSYFEVRGRLRLADRILDQRTLLKRNTQNGDCTVLDQERVATVDAAGS